MKAKETLVCRFCGKELTQENKKEFDGTTMCEECLEQRTTICAHCRDRVWNDDVRGDANTNLCSYCFEHSYPETKLTSKMSCNTLRIIISG